MAEQYYSLMTDAGDAAIIAAAAIGGQKAFTHLAVGDGGGSYYEPIRSQTALKGEKWRGAASVERDVGNPKRVVVTASIPSAIGGFQVREAGVFDDSGVLMVISKQPLSDKVAPSSGAGKDITIRIYVEITDGKAEAVTITVDPSAQMVSRLEFAKHAEDDGLHTTAEKQTANAAHLADRVSHITAGEREAWSGKVGKSTSVAATLTAAGWVGSSAPFTQVLSIAAVTAASANEVLRPLALTEAIRDAWDAAAFADGGQSAGKLTVTAWGEKPTINLPCRIIIRGDL